MGRFFTSLLIFTAVFLTSVSINKTFANVEMACLPQKAWYEKIQAVFDLDIRRTAVNFASATLTDATFQGLTGTDLETFLGCMPYIKEMGGGALAGMNIPPECVDPSKSTRATCDGILNQYRDTEVSYGYSKNLANSLTGGSLLGLAYMANNIATYEPLPVNLAYYWNDTISKVPLMNQTLAAEVNYTGPLKLLETVLVVWKVIRNGALGAMAVMMLIIGIMIMARKKVNQQVVVSIQYALPKVVMALILIVFSYPIGATIASLAWTLKMSAHDIVRSLIAVAAGPATSGALEIRDTSIAMIIIVLLGIILATGGSALVSILLFAVTASVIIILLFALIQVKILAIYVKMIVSVVASPIKFALSAIPGNDTQITDWFKQMATYTLQIFFTNAAFYFVWYISWSIINVNFLNQADTGNFVETTGGVLLTIFAPLFIVIFGLYYTLQVPAKVEAMIMGDKKPARR